MITNVYVELEKKGQQIANFSANVDGRKIAGNLFLDKTGNYGIHTPYGKRLTFDVICELREGVLKKYHERIADSVN